MQPYAKRFGAGYTDYFRGNFFGNAVLPALFHEDPSYYPKGSGSFISRFLWAAASAGWCKRDRGAWGPNTEAQIAALKQVEAGRTVDDVAREQGVDKHTIYAWKAKYGGIELSEAEEITGTPQREVQFLRVLKRCMIPGIVYGTYDMDGIGLEPRLAGKERLRHFAI